MIERLEVKRQVLIFWIHFGVSQKVMDSRLTKWLGNQKFNKERGAAGAEETLTQVHRFINTCLMRPIILYHVLGHCGIRWRMWPELPMSDSDSCHAAFDDAFRVTTT